MTPDSSAIMVLREEIPDLSGGYNQRGLPKIVARAHKKYASWWPRSNPDFSVEASNQKITDVTDTLAMILDHMETEVHYDTDSTSGRINRSTIRAGEDSVYCMVAYIPPQVNGSVTPAKIHADIKFNYDSPDMHDDYEQVLNEVKKALPDLCLP